MNRLQRSCLSAILLLLTLTAVAAAQVTVDFLDVGQGDAILITTTQGGSVLIDGGTERAGSVVVAPYLRQLGIERLDLVVATHPHADHIGGLISVLGQVSVSAILADAQIHTTRTYERFLLLIDEKRIPFFPARSGMHWEIPGIDRFAILHPQEEWLNGLNNNSVVVRMKVGDIVFLFTGDIEREAEAYLVAGGNDLSADILKIAHHGSRSSTTPAFLERVDPRIAVIMVGQDNPYNHPHPDVILRLSTLEVYRTDIHGHIRVQTDGDNVSVSTHKAVAPIDARINLLKATATELTALPGIGEVLAARIVEFRQSQGIRRVDDLLQVSGIGAVTLERIKDYVYLGEGATN